MSTIPIPQLPTDNLYKFIAMTSAFFVLVILVSVPYYNYIVQVKNTENKIAIEKLNKGLEYYKYIDDDILEKKLAFYLYLELKKDTSLASAIDSGKVTTEDLSRDFIKYDFDDYIMYNKLNNNLDSGDVEIAEKILEEIRMNEKRFSDHGDSVDVIEMKTDEVGFLVNNVNGYFIAFLFIFFSAAMVYGFTMWYKRVQKYEDKILKNRAESITDKAFEEKEDLSKEVD